MRNLLLFASLSYLLGGCITPTTSQQQVSMVPANEIHDLLILEPITEIRYSNKSSQGLISAEYSSITAANVKKGLPDVIPSGLDYQILSLNQTLNNTTVDKEIYKLVNIIERRQSIKGVKLSPRLMGLLENSNQNYVMSIMVAGFMYSENDPIDGVVGKRGCLEMLSLKSKVPKSMMTKSILICLVLDKEKKNVAFYRKYSLYKRKPFEKEVTDFQMKYVLGKYFKDWEEHNLAEEIDGNPMVLQPMTNIP